MIWGFLKSPLGLKVLAGIVLAAALGGVYLHIYNKGHDAGRAEGNRDALELGRKQFEQQRRELADAVANTKQDQANAKKDQDAAQKQIQAADNALEVLANARIASHAAVARLADADVGRDIHKKLGSPPNDAPLTVPELRRVDDVLTDYGDLQRQVDLLNKKSEQQDERSAAQEKRIGAIEVEKAAYRDAYNELVPHYVEAYNAAQTKHSRLVKIITLGLVRDRKLALPDPAGLKKLP